MEMSGAISSPGFLSHLRYKQQAVGGQCADEDGSSHRAVHQVGPGLQEDRHRNSHSRGQGDQADRCYDGGRLVDRRMADVGGQPSQIGAIKQETTLERDVERSLSKI